MKFAFYNGFTDYVMKNGVRATLAFMEERGLSHGELFDVCIPGAMKGQAGQSNGSVIAAAAAEEAMRGEPIPIACYSVGADFNVYGDRQTRDELLLHAERAARIGAPVFHHTSVMGLRRQTLTEDPRAVIDRLLEPIARVAERVVELGMTPVYEPQGMVFNGVENFLYFMEKLNTDMGVSEARVCMDFGNTRFRDTDPLSFLEAVKPLVAHVHLKDYRIMSVEAASAEGYGQPRYISYGGDAIVGVPFLQGDSGLVKGVNSLLDYGYEGVFSIESDMKGQSGAARVGEDARLIREAVGR